MSGKRTIAAVAGPTAVGKTEYTIELALEINAEIVSCDSMQLYKYMDIGSAKPTDEERSRVKHYLVDEIDPKEDFSVAKYQKLAKAAIEHIFAEGKVPLVTGGTGLYLDSLIYDMDFGPKPDTEDNAYRKQLYDLAAKSGNEALHKRLEEADPEAAARIHPNNVKKAVRAIEAAERYGRPVEPFERASKKTNDYDVILIGLKRDRAELYDRINKRVDILEDMGLVDEVKSLRDMGFTTDDIAMKGIGYKEILDALNGKCTIEEALETVKKNTRHYAKRQMTWFRRYDDMKWFDLTEADRNETIREMTEWVQKRL